VLKKVNGSASVCAEFIVDTPLSDADQQPSFKALVEAPPASQVKKMTERPRSPRL